MKELKTEVLICGGGIIGLTIARELANRGNADILIIEKEEAVGLHASGRNSGVLHAGIYYAPDSLRAASCLRGNRLMKEYCREHGLPLLESGKVIVAKTEEELPVLDELYRRAQANGSPVSMLNEKELAELEPSARTRERALHSPETAMVNPKAIMKSLYDDLAKKKNITILTGTKFLKQQGSGSILTDKGPIQFNTFINAAGAYSDRIAHAFGLGRDYRLIPFKGTYRKLSPASEVTVRGNIYPVPNIRNPFLGVHFTRGVDGTTYMGPTAIPAFGRENYGLVEGMDSEAPALLLWDALLLFSNAGFRHIALSEPAKYIGKFFFRDAEKLVRGLRPRDIIHSDKSGIRPQLIDGKKREMIMDFIVLIDGPSLHILNAISPAFTASMDFARMIVDEYL